MQRCRGADVQLMCRGAEVMQRSAAEKCCREVLQRNAERGRGARVGVGVGIVADVQMSRCRGGMMCKM